jgi:SAM-dependent methyltransferase
MHAKTQYDSYTGTNISEKRFFDETKWPKRMEGELILEVGSGSGRFTEQVASTGATVVSVDYSRAVDANYALNGHRQNVLITQGDIYKLPLREEFFDRVFCFGVLQHTPNPRKAFMALRRCLKAGGNLVIDVYESKGWKRTLETKYWFRPITRRIEPILLYSLCERYVESMWPLTRWISKCLDDSGRQLSWRVLIADYTGMYDLSADIAKEWAILEMFDMLSPRYDYPQTLQAVQEWFREANLTNCKVGIGYNGVYGRGTKQFDEQRK